MLAQRKYDGNYATVRVEGGYATFTTSGGHTYTHTDDGNASFKDVTDAVYFAERIGGKGMLGDRTKCNLKGPKGAQHSTGHSYKVFDRVILEEYDRGFSTVSYTHRYMSLVSSGVPASTIVTYDIVESLLQAKELLDEVVAEGYEGLMLYAPDFKWRDTKSRTVDLVKYKQRRTADLRCIDITEGTGKYEGMIGSLKLVDSEGRVVDVGSGLNDHNREYGEFIGHIIEIEYEQIMKTYIQPSFLRIRYDKEECD